MQKRPLALTEALFIAVREHQGTPVLTGKMRTTTPLFQPPCHLLHGLFLQGKVGMHIEIERGVDARMTQQGAHGFIVALALDATGGKSMPESVERDVRQSQLFADPVKVVSEDTGLWRLRRVGEHIPAGLGVPFDRP